MGPPQTLHAYTCQVLNFSQKSLILNIRGSGKFANSACPNMQGFENCRESRSALSITID